MQSRSVIYATTIGPRYKSSETAETPTIIGNVDLNYALWSSNRTKHRIASRNSTYPRNQPTALSLVKTIH